MDAYGRAWISNDADEVAALFTEDAVYHHGPFREPTRGRLAIVAAWVDGATLQQQPTFEHDELVVTETTGVAHWTASWIRDGRAPVRVRLDGVLVATFDPAGRCVEHREWFSREEDRLG